MMILPNYAAFARTLNECGVLLIVNYGGHTKSSPSSPSDDAIRVLLWTTKILECPNMAT